MKKILLSALAVVAMGFTAAAEDWYVCGAFQGWDAGNAPQMTAAGENTVVLEVAQIQSGFKIINAQGWGQGEWGAVGSAKVVLGTPFQLTNSGAGDISFADYEVINNATLSLNTTTHELTVTGTPNLDLPDLWMTGGFTGWATPGAGSSAPQFAEEGGVYTATIEFSGESEFKICGSGWAPQWGWYTPSAHNTLSDENLADVLDKKDGNDPGNGKFNFTGEYVVTFTYETGAISFAKVAGVTSVEENVDAPVVYYNLQGVRVENPVNGVFVKVQGNKVSKIIR